MGRGAGAFLILTKPHNIFIYKNNWGLRVKRS